MKNIAKKFSKYIYIGGCQYHRTAVLDGQPISIYAATENKLSIKRHAFNEDNQEWIELDNDKLVIYEKGEMIPAYRYPKLN